MSEKLFEYSINDVPKVIDYLKQQMKKYKILTFSGSLGAGKTTLIRELLQSCGISEPVISPTFGYVNIYKNKSGQTFYHFDLYRLDSLQDFMAQGFDEYLQRPDSWVLIEWPEIIQSILLDNVLHCFIDYKNPEKRSLKVIAS